MAQIFDLLSSQSTTPTNGGVLATGIPVPSAYRYLGSICYGSDDRTPELTLPCNAIDAIRYECLLGPKIGLPYFIARSQGKQEFTVDGQTIKIYGNNFEPHELGNSTQRDCICMSQYFDQSAACRQCYARHGDTQLEHLGTYGGLSFEDARVERQFSSSYCAATNTPTADFVHEVRSFPPAQPPTTTNPWNGYATDIPDAYESSIEEAADATSTDIFRDPLANKTDVSLYYTPSVTGSAAYVLGGPTNTADAGTSDFFSTTNVVDGQILPTASPDNTVTHTLPPSKYSERVEGLTANATAPPGPNSGDKASRSSITSVLCSLLLIASVLI